MKKKLYHCIHFLFVLSIATFAQAQNVSYIYIKDIPAKTNYADDFDKIADNVNENYTHLNAKHINGDSLRAQYLEQVKKAGTNIAYGDILLRYFAALRNSHANAIFKKYYRNCAATLIENRVFISSLGDSQLIKNGVREKDEIIKINHVPVNSYILAQAKYTAASTDIHRTYLTVSGLFSSYYAEDRTYTIKTSTGEKDITIHFDDAPVPEVPKPVIQPTPGKVEGKLLNDSVAYMAITSMTGDVVDDFVKAFDTLSQKKVLVIDLRRNQGGNSGFSEKIAEYLVPEKQKAAVSGRWLRPRESHFTGKLFVLTSPYTCSAAESFALDLLESGAATLVGMPTAGDTGNQPRFYNSDLGYSYWFPSRGKAQVSPKGFPMEGESIKPHYTVAKTVADFLANKDTILNYTLRLIKGN